MNGLLKEVVKNLPLSVAIGLGMYLGTVFNTVLPRPKVG